MVLHKLKVLLEIKFFVFLRKLVWFIFRFQNFFLVFYSNWKLILLFYKIGLAPEIPEDLYMLIKKAVAVRKHLERSKKDKDSKFRLILIESRIHRLERLFLSFHPSFLTLTILIILRLARYYRLSKKLPASWKYESATASTLVA